MDESEFYLPQEIRYLINNSLPGFEIAAENEFFVPKQWSPVEDSFFYKYDQTQFYISEDFNLDGVNDYAFFLSSNELLEQKKDTSWYYTLIFGLSDKNQGFVLIPKEPFIRFRLGSDLITEKIGLLKMGNYQRGYPYYDSLSIKKIPIGHSIYECCVKSYTWDEENNKFSEEYFFHE